MKRVLLTASLILVLVVAVSTMSHSQTGPSHDTATSHRVFELRTYHVNEGKLSDLHKRFREGEVEVFKKNGVEVLAVWQNLDDPNTLVYLLTYKDRAAREAGWAGFSADPKWTELRTKYFVPLTAKVTFMSATDYSPLK